MKNVAPGRPRVLICDDEPNIRMTLALCLERAECGVALTASSQEALREAKQHPFDVAFVDLQLGADSGLDLVSQLLCIQPTLAIVVMTAFATIETAVSSIQRGASEYVSKPFTPAQIRHALERVLSNRP